MQRTEDLLDNPFMVVLRRDHDELLKDCAKNKDGAVLVVPQATSLKGVAIKLNFVETHVLQLQPACSSGSYINLVGQGIEIKEKEKVLTTSFGFRHYRRLNILEEQSIYEFNAVFKILVVDNPIIGEISSQIGENKPRETVACCDLLNSAPEVENELFDRLHSFRQRYVQVKGCEKETARRIGVIAEDVVLRLTKHFGALNSADFVHVQVERTIYAALHAFIWPHLLTATEEHANKLHAIFQAWTPALVCQELKAPERFAAADLRAASEKLKELDLMISPMEKLQGLQEVVTAAQNAANTGGGVTGQGGGSRKNKSVTDATLVSTWYVLFLRWKFPIRLGGGNDNLVCY